MNRLAKLAHVLRHPRWLSVLLTHRVAASAEHLASFSSLDFATVVDVGANVGQFALLAQRLFPRARIISFEPLPKPAATFRSVFAGDSRVTLHECAIGPGRQQATMHLSAALDSSSLLPIGSAQVENFPGTAETGTAEVSVRPLSDLVDCSTFERPALLKVDVQGFELQALQGCESSIDRFDFVYCEASFVELYEGQAYAADVIDWLRAREFRLVGVFNLALTRRGACLQADFLFKRSTWQ
jgi:FkbM family methyltransferase